MTNEELVMQIKTGINTTDNMLALWEQNKRFIYSRANRYKGLAEMEDLEQEGYLALYDAIDSYEPELGYKFLSYAEYWIKQRIVRYIKNNGTVRIPEHEIAKISAYKKVVNACQIHLGRKPSRHEIAHYMGIPYKMVIDLEKAAQLAKLKSLDSQLVEDDDSITLGDTVPGDVDVEGDVLEYIQNEELKAILWPMVDALPEQQGEVIRQSFQEEKTLKDIGENIGVTSEGVRRLTDKALRELRKSQNIQLLRSFLIAERAYSMALNGNGVEMFNKTWTSSTERAALWLHEKKQAVN